MESILHIPTMLDYLKSGIKNKIKPTTPKNVTLVLGLAGSRKRDLIQFISGNEQLNNSLDDFTTSSTEFPGLMADSKTNTTFYEYPKFGESKTAEEEISAALLLKDIVDYADSIKLIFAIPESQDKSGLDDKHIDSLIDDSVKIIEHFKELEDSIALVVTRVGKNDSVSDEDVIKNTSANLMDTLKKYSDSGNASDLKKQNLINILLREKNGIYTNIGVFKKPEIFVGQLIESEALNANKTSLETVINVNTKFVAHDKNNFQCSSCLDNMINDLRSGLSDNVREIKRIVLEYFENEENNSEDFKELENKYLLGISFLTDLQYRYFSSTKDLLRQLLITLEDPNKLHISIPKKIDQSIDNYAEYMSLFLQKSSLESSKYYSAFAEIDKEHLSILTDVIQDLAKSQAWYSALVLLHAELSNYHMKKSEKTDSLYDKAKPETCDVSLIKKTYDDAKQNISEAIADIFKGKDGGEFHPQTIADFLQMASISQACQAKLKVLSTMLYSLFSSSTDDARTSCSDGIFKIEGQFVKLSDVPEPSKNRKCDRDASDVREIRLFASNRVYVDADLHLTGDGIQLSIIAPTWEVVGDRKIVLDGKPGGNHTDLVAPPADPKIPGNAGNDGKPGKPGGPAGDFLGIGSDFIRGGNLNITVVGGTGGPGQKGSDGISGEHKIPSSMTAELDINGCAKINLIEKCDFGPSDAARLYPHAVLEEYYCHDDRNTCRNGGNGGKGGAGGKGGLPGERKLIELLMNSSIVGQSVEGPTGINGDPGVPGKRGEKGMILNYTLKINKRVGHDRNYMCKRFHRVVDEKISYDVKCEDGRLIDYYFNRMDIESPKSSDARLSANAINDYKSYLRTVLADEEHGKVRGRLLTDFIADLEKNKLVKELYHAEEFTDELKSLETQFYSLQDKLSFSTFYESLLNRITEYADEYYNQHSKNRNVDEKQPLQDDESKALRYLYAATLSKIFNLRDDKSGNLVVDIETYLELAKENVDKLKEYKKIKLMNEANQSYYSTLDEKIQKAKNFVQQITREIDVYFGNLDAKIKSLIAEAGLLEEKVKDQMENLVEMKQKIKNAMVLRAFFSVTKMVGTLLSAAGPVGAAAGAALTGSAMVIESLSVSDVNKDNIKAADIPKVFNKNMATMETMFDEDKVHTFKAQLDAILGAFDATEKSAEPPKSVQDLKKAISKIREEVKDKKDEAASTDKLSEKVAKVTELLEKQAEALGNDKYKDDKAIQAWSKHMNRAVNVIKIVQVPLSIYEDVAAANKKSDLVVSAYKDSEDQLKKLDAYKKQIQDSILPQFKNLQRYLSDTLGEKGITRTNSMAGLDVGQWKMQDILNDLKDYMRKITEGFEVQEDITRLIEKIDRALFAMIDIYRGIEDYRDKKELADYIQNINPASSETEMIVRKELKNAIDELKVIIQSNIVVEEYQRAIHAVKQTVYPLARHYLEAHEFSPFSGSDPSNITSFATDVAKQLDLIKRTFKDNRASVGEYDGYIMPDADFVAEDDDLRGAFYTWRYAENKHAISQLLRGKKVTLKSDITKGIGLPAIKFRKIGVNFKLADAAAEREFKRKLNGFVLTMWHLGNSQYQCNDKFHTITNKKQRLVIEFATSKGNTVFTKLKDNEALLSPYTSWTLSLSSPKKFSFDTLAQYENMTIDLALVGSADYLGSTDDDSEAAIDAICNGNLSKYYNEDKTIRMTPAELTYNRKVLDEIPGLGESIIKDRKNRPRMRRSLADLEFEQDLEEDPFSTSGACSDMKSSFINNIFNLIGTGLVAYEYLNPVNKISQWFARKYETNIDREDSFVLDSDLPASGSIKILNVQYPATESPKISKMFIDDELPTTNNLLSDSSFCNHGNLLLLDLVIRSKSGVKHSHPSFAPNANVDPEYAQHLAYSEHR